VVSFDWAKSANFATFGETFGWTTNSGATYTIASTKTGSMQLAVAEGESFGFELASEAGRFHFASVDINDLSVTPVPEPVTGPLVVGGFLGLIWLGRNRAKMKAVWVKKSAESKNMA